MNASGLTYPNRLTRALFEALESTAGPTSLHQALVAAGLNEQYAAGQLPPNDLETGIDFAEISEFSRSLEVHYGALGGRGIALRVGHAFFEKGLKNYGVLRGISTPEFAKLPPPAQAKISLMGLASVFSSISDQSMQLTEERDAFHMIVETSPFAWDRVSDRPVCHVMVGVLQATLRWATRGYEFAVYETACHATGGQACVFQIGGKPIGRV